VAAPVAQRASAAAEEEGSSGSLWMALMETGVRAAVFVLLGAVGALALIILVF
jgi:hypothetical protein